MPLAYDAQGRLKKRALLGTSFAVDPTKSKQREQFKALHEEAKTRAGQGRDFMLGQVQDRWQNFEEDQTSKLQALAEQKQGFASELAGVRDPEEEARFEAYRELKAMSNQPGQYRNLAKAGIPEEFLKEAEREYYKLHPSRQQVKGSLLPSERARMEQAGLLRRGGGGSSVLDKQLKPLKTLGKIKPIKKIGKKIKKFFGGKSEKEREKEKEIKRQRNLAKYVKQKLEEQYNEQLARDYEERAAAETERFQRSYMTAQEEENMRMQRLADRAELYNMFLGE